MKTTPHLRFPALCSALAGSFLLSVSLQGGIMALTDLIENPTDSGSGPAIWYATSGGTNSGSAASSLTTATLDRFVPDHFGTAGAAFALRDGATSPAGISGSRDTGFATGSNGTVVLTFQTPATLANSTIFSRGTDPNPPNLEIVLLGNGGLRLTLADQSRTTISTVSSDTWYYLAVSWDTSLASNQVTWHLGAMGGAPTGLSSGTITAASVGNPDQSIFIAGRPGNPGSFLYAGAFQNIAIYDRTLSNDAIVDQFSAIPEPSVYAAIIGALALGLVIRRRKSKG